MQVTALEVYDKKRYKIFIDNEFAFVLYKGDIRSYGIREGEVIEKNCYEEIQGTLLCKRALSRALYLLEKKDYSIKKLSEKLRDGLYPSHAIEYAVDKLSDYGYIDDIRYATRFVENRMSSRSKQQIISDLYNRGISKETALKAFDNAYEDGYQQDNLALIRSILQKRHYYDSKEHTKKERDKQYVYLMSKGFNSSDIRAGLLDIT